MRSQVCIVTIKKTNLKMKLLVAHRSINNLVYCKGRGRRRRWRRAATATTTTPFWRCGNCWVKLRFLSMNWKLVSIFTLSTHSSVILWLLVEQQQQQWHRNKSASFQRAKWFGISGLAHHQFKWNKVLSIVVAAQCPKVTGVLLNLRTESCRIRIISN